MDEHRPEAEAKMRQALGVSGVSGGSRPTMSDDPQRLARHAIRAQAAARDYAERQLVRAEQLIQEFHAKVHVLRREKALAMETARVAHDAQAQAERACRAAEIASRNEKSTSDRAQQEAGEARVLVQGLRTKLAHANQAAETLQGQLEQERQARIAAEQALSVARPPAVTSAIGDPADERTVKPMRGRPSETKGRPLRAQASWRAAGGADQAPVQWWTDGWTPRS